MKNKYCLVSYVVFFLVVMGCKPQGDDRVYGDWYEPFQGQKVTFKKDKSVDWFGKSGTFEFKKNSNFFCGMSKSGCPDGEVQVKVSKQNFRISYHFKEEKPDRWGMSFRAYGGKLKMATLSSNKIAHGLTLSRYKLKSIPFNSPNLIQTNISNNLFYKSFSAIGSHKGTVYGQILDFETNPLHSYNPGTHAWKKVNLPKLDDPDISVDIRIGKDTILYGLSDYSHFSNNGGKTWKEVPDFYRHGPYSTTDNILTSGIYVHGSLLFQMIQKDFDDHQRTRIYELIKMDLEADDLKWTKSWHISTFQENENEFDFAFLEKTNDILIFARNKSEKKIHHSSDGGESWHTLSDSISEKIVGTENHYYRIKNSSSSLIAYPNSGTAYWFKGETDEWKKISVKIDYSSEIHHDNLWFIDDWQIYKMDFEGNKTKVGERLPPSDFDTPFIKPTDQAVFLNFYVNWEVKKGLF